MSWLNNASSIASLIMAIVGFIGYIYGAMSYLVRKAHTTPNGLGYSASSTSKAQKSSIPYRPLSWLEWMEMFGKGLMDTAEFVLNFLYDNYPERYFDTPAYKLGGCAILCGFFAIVGGLAMGVVIGIFLGALGMSNPPGAATAIVIILLFVFFSLLYIYH